MRKNYLLLGALTLMLFVGLLAVGRPAAAQEQVGPNLLQNAGFEEGHFNQDGIAEITVPNGWRMHWSNNELIFGGEWPTARPETVVWNATGGIPEGEEIFWRDGIFTMKVFKSWAPMWAAMSQDVSGLEVGRKYRLVTPIFVDIFEEIDGGRKVIPTRKDTGRVRLGASPVGANWRDENAIAYSGWWTAETIDPFYQAFPTFIYDFVATEPNMTIWIEMASTYPYPNNGFFYDLPGLYALNETAPVAAPPATAGGGAPVAAAPAQPLPTLAPPEPREDGSIVHVVQPGESLWGIAIQYASVVGRTPEDTLPYLQELNNSPVFINPGDELLILAAGAAGAEEAPAEGEVIAEADVPAEGEAAVSEESVPAEGEAAAGDAPVEEETQPIDAAATDLQPAEAVQPSASLAGSVCVAAFNDANADGLRDGSENLVPNAAIAIARAGNTVSTYITDGVSEPYCFELVDADTYQMQIYPPAGFVPTTESSWAVSVANGESYTVSFGLREGEQAVAAVDMAVSDTADAAMAETPSESGGLADNLGLIVLGVAGVLVLVAILGVVLLRRG